MKVRSYLTGLLLAIAPLCLCAQSQVDTFPKPTDYVSDLANVIDPASKDQIDQVCSALDHQAHAQIAVVTIDSLNGEPIEQFATELEDKWKVGPKATDRGLIMIFAIKEHKRRIEVGYGLEGILNDAKVGDIGRSMKPQLEQSQYGPAILGGLNQIADVIAKDAGVTLASPDAQPMQDSYRQQAAPRRHGSNIAGIIRIIIFVVVLITLFSGRGRGGGGWLWFLLGNMLGGGGGRGRDDGWGGGGGSGGGFGGFGGGSSGGGGASGDW